MLVFQKLVFSRFRFIDFLPFNAQDNNMVLKSSVTLSILFWISM